MMYLMRKIPKVSCFFCLCFLSLSSRSIEGKEFNPGSLISSLFIIWEWEEEGNEEGAGDSNPVTIKIKLMKHLSGQRQVHFQHQNVVPAKFQRL